jgi:hypothetical protein
MPSNKNPQITVQSGPGRLPANTVPAGALIFPPSGSSDAALQAHITDPVGAHEASAISTDALGAWADTITNPAADAQTQLAKIILDLTSTSDTPPSKRGAGKITAPAATSWADGTTNPAANLDVFLDNIIKALVSTTNRRGAGKITAPAASAWADGTTNPADDLDTFLDSNIIKALVANAGSDRINSGAVAASLANPDILLAAGDSIYDQLADIIGFIDTILASRDNTWGGKQILNSSADTHAPLLMTGRVSVPTTNIVEGDIYSLLTGSDVSSIQMRMTGVWRTITESKQTREFYYPTPAGIGACVDETGKTQWCFYSSILNTLFEWRSDDEGRDEWRHLIFGLNRFIHHDCKIMTITVKVKPGAARATEADRMIFRLMRCANDGGSTATLGGTFYDSGASSEQYIVMNLGAGQTLNTDLYQYWLDIAKGDTTDIDRVYSVKISFEEPDSYLALP